MFLKNYHHLKKKEIYILIFLFLSSVLIRIPTIFILGDASLENEWKDIVNSLSEHRQFLYKGLPNIFIPPLYAFYLYFFSIFNLEEQNYIQLILLSQVLLSSISVVVFYKLNKIFFSQKISFYSSLLFSLFPLHVFACSQISSISLQICLTMFFFHFFFKFIEKKDLISIIFFSFITGLLILLRGEFLVIFSLSVVYLIIFFKVPIRNVLLIILISTMLVVPFCRQ